MKFGFIAKHRGIWPVAWLCAALGVSRSGFHAWLGRLPSARSRSDEVLGAKVRAVSSPPTGPTAPVGCGTMCWPKASHAACTASSG